MPTKKEIFFKNKDKWEKELNSIGYPKIDPVYDSMEEYAKQEALGALQFYKGRTFNHTITWKDLTETWDEFYEKYQKSKLKK